MNGTVDSFCSLLSSDLCQYHLYWTTLSDDLNTCINDVQLERPAYAHDNKGFEYLFP